MSNPVTCRVAELQLLSREELEEEQARLVREIGVRSRTVARGKSVAPDSRLSQAAHDYVDVQYLLRHLPSE